MPGLPAFQAQSPYLHSFPALAGPWCVRCPRREHTSHRLPKWLPVMQAEQNGLGDWMEPVKPTLEQSLDAIDDVYMDRQPGEGRDKVKVFGAWLDADIAGRKAGQGNRAAGLIARADRGEELSDQEMAEIFYEEAISVMRRRECDNAVALLEEAVALAGEDSRRGGEFKLWAAQALQEAGRNEQAVGVLKSLKGHRDLDVRKVGAELLYIAQAPKLALNDKDFVEFPDVSSITEPYDKKEMGKPKVTPWKKPEKENDFFYVEEGAGQAPGNDPVMLLAAIACILGLSYVFLG